MVVRQRTRSMRMRGKPQRSAIRAVRLRGVMYKLKDKYWRGLIRSIVLISIVSLFLIGFSYLVFLLEQRLLNADIDQYTISNGMEPSREVQREFWKASKIKTLPLLGVFYALIGYLSVKYLGRLKTK